MKNKRLLILSCSACKSDARICPAIDRYQSPAFYLVRRWLRMNDDQNTLIWIISAKYGLITANRKTENYDLAMTRDRAEFMAEKIRNQFSALHKLSFESLTSPASVFCHLPFNYRDPVNKYLVSIRKTVAVEFATGTPGIKLRQLKNWLEKGI